MTERLNLDAAYEHMEALSQPRATGVSVVRKPPPARLPLATLRAQFPERTDEEIVAALDATNDAEMTCRVVGEYVLVEVAK